MNSRRLVIANWKVNGSLVQNQEFLTKLVSNLVSYSNPHSLPELVICPPYPYLSSVLTYLDEKLPAQYIVELGAQNLAAVPAGSACTGEVAAEMLADLSCRYVIIGHSERRELLQETNAVLLKKIALAYAAHLNPVFCLGEPLVIRQAGWPEVRKYLTQQLEPVLNYLVAEVATIARRQDWAEHLILAYEPVWAIGSGMVPTAEQVAQVLTYLHNLCVDYLGQALADQIRFVYGGSVNSTNAASFLTNNKLLTGFLVGSASLSADKLVAIMQNLCFAC